MRRQGQTKRYEGLTMNSFWHFSTSTAVDVSIFPDHFVYYVVLTTNCFSFFHCFCFICGCLCISEVTETVGI